MSVNFEEIANKLIIKLEEVDIKCYIWHIATTGSVYLRFGDNRMCSVRLRDHSGRNKLKYKYNLRSDASPNYKKWIKDKGVWRFYINIQKWEELVFVLQDRFNQIQDWGKVNINIMHLPLSKII